MNVLVKPPLELKKRQLTTRQQSLPNFSLGERGEQRARAFIQKLGYQLVEHNIRLKNHEIDIIALDKKTNELVFIEVKTRTSEIFGDPSLAVSARKLKSLQKVALWYIETNSLENDYRFDIISVLPHKIQHFENITWNWR